METKLRAYPGSSFERVEALENKKTIRYDKISPQGGDVGSKDKYFISITILPEAGLAHFQKFKGIYSLKIETGRGKEMGI